MKLRYESLVFIFLALAGYRPAAAQVVLKPQFQKLGVVQPGKHYHLKVKITNPTDQTISLWNLRADCDCTSAHIAQAVLKPKASTTMTIVYHPQEGESGFKTFTVNFQVYSQDKNKGIQRTMEKFMFSADLHSTYVFDPTTLDCGFERVGHPLEAKGTLKLDAKSYSKWQPVSAEASIPGLGVGAKPMTTKGIFEIDLSVPATLLSAGNYSGVVTISGNAGKKASVFLYPFKIAVGSLWSVSPNRLDLGELDPAKTKNWKWNSQVREIYGKPFKIIKLEGLPDWLNYHIGKSPAGDTQIQWEIDKGKFEKAKSGPLESEITVQTDFKDEPGFKIPFHSVKAGQK